MARQYSNRSFVPSDNSSRQFQQTPNDFSYFQYPPHRQTAETNHRPSLPFNRITVRKKFFFYYYYVNIDFIGCSNKFSISTTLSF